MSGTFNILFILSLLAISTSCSKRSFDVNEKVSQRKENSLKQLALNISEISEELDSGEVFIEKESGRAMGPMERASLIHDSIEKRQASSLFNTNERIIRAVGNLSLIHI